MSFCSRPNIVLITTDTQGREMLSTYVDRSGVETPCLDRMAYEGVVFENAFTAAPVCTPARGSWYTGLPPNRHGAMGNEMAVSRAVPFLGELLAQSGYRTHHVGKWHLDAAGYAGAGSADGGFAPASWYDLSCFYDEVGREGLNKFGGWNKGLEDESFCFGHRVADRAIEIIERSATKSHEPPLFLSVEFDEPHGPYICPPPFRDRFSPNDIFVPESLSADLAGKPELQKQYSAYLRDVFGPEPAGTAPGADRARTPSSGSRLPRYYAKYYSCNSYVDYEIGRIVDAIRRRSSADTLVLFTSDHGDHLGAFGLGPKGPTMYDHTVAVPLIAWSPALEGGRREAGLVSALDLFPTVLEAAGVAFDNKQSAGYAGRSLMPVLFEDADSIRDSVTIEYNRFGIQFNQVRGFYPIRCIRTAGWKLVINLFDRDELYAVADDPGEVVNRIDDPACVATRNELHDRLLESMYATQDLLRGPEWANRSWRTNHDRSFVGFTTTGFTEEWPDGTWGRKDE